MRARAQAEWHRLHGVLMHEPGIEVFFALISPKKHLYERFFNLDAAHREHQRLCEVLKDEFGVRVHRLTDAALEGVQNPRHRETLLNLAEEPAGETDLALAGRDDRHLLARAILGACQNGGEVTLRGTMHNLYFMRDQQVCTDQGMVMGRMATTERQREGALTGIALSAIGAGPVGLIRRGHLEGGDFIPAGKFALLGYGSRTDREGADALLWAGSSFDEVAVVREPVHPLIEGADPMVNMHLDTYCNLAGDGVAVGNPALLERAEVKVLANESGIYRPTGWEGSLAGFLKEKDFSIVPVTTLEQLCYAANFLCVRERECVAVDTGQVARAVIKRLRMRAAAKPGVYDRLLAQAETDYRQLRLDAEFFPFKKEVYAEGVEMTPIDLHHATGGYGGAHCMTCPVRRG
ncbi:amidinotransferase [Methanofollis aquaemaris]|uniref:Amidinotransferase n=1 Tax=Methanofollis aquaemaris TaxID=126734 RepID=A0A8A3S8L3_9EURY|nr:arginine deiminase family protein [Methanofollis aquaemaris]QSZ68020.1 amidinotransferase [Methanofollis aquaemaris]